MGLFKKRNDKRSGVFTNVGVPLTLTNIVILVVLTLVLIQAAGLIFGWTNVTLGPVFVLLAVGMAAVVSVAVFKKISDGLTLDARDVYAILIVVVIALFLMFFLKEFVPEIFRESIGTIQSFIIYQ